MKVTVITIIHVNLRKNITPGPRVPGLLLSLGHGISIYIVYVIESAAYRVLFTSCLCQKPERAIEGF